MHDTSVRMLSSLHRWDECSLSTCEEVACSIERMLPETWDFEGVETHQVGMQRHQIAHFVWRGTSPSMPSRFVLIPGGTATLGYDRMQLLAPEKELVEEWWEKWTLGTYGDRITLDGALVRDIVQMRDDTLVTYLAENLLPLRTVTLLPFLLETEAQEAEQVLPVPLMNYVRYQAAWGTASYKTRSIHRGIPHRHIVTFLKQQGCRLPSADEWEYACAAGSRTIFHWGNGPFTPGETRDMPPVVRNAFGLKIADDSYAWECCGDPSMMQGGDGGVSACEDRGVLESFLPHASAYYCRLKEKQINNGVYGLCFRRVVDLPHPYV